MADFRHNLMSATRRIKAIPSFINTNSNGNMWKVINRSVPAVVLKLEHYEGLGIVRSLGKLGIPVYGIDAAKLSHSSLSRYCKKTFVWDMENSPEEESVNFLVSIANSLGKQSILIATSDETSLFIAKNAERLKSYFLFPDNSYELINTLCSKEKSYFLARQYGMPIPESFFPTSMEDVFEFAEYAAYPVMLKGIYGGRLEKKTGKKMTIVKNKTELLSLYKLMEDRAEPNLMIQEYIPQSKNQMWVYNGYFDSYSNCLAAFTGIKIRQNPVYTGMTSFGVCRWNEELIEIAAGFLKSISYCGAVDIDFIYDERDAKYKILDINPRVGASFRMFVGTNGIDVVRAKYLDITNQPVHFSKPPEGRKWFVEDKDLLSSVRYYKNGELKFREWFNSLNGVKESGYYSFNDPLPFLFLWLNHFIKSCMKLLKKIIIGFPFFGSRKKAGRLAKSEMSRAANVTSNPIANGTGQLKRVEKFFDQNKNWQGAIYETSDDPHAMGTRRRIEYIFQNIDKSYNLKNIKALDIGCGPGAYLNELNKRGSYTFGIDLSKKMLKACRKKLNNKEMTNLLSADITSLPFGSKSFDLVLCVGVLQYVLSIESAIAELNRVTKKGGVVIICFENMMAGSNIGYTLVYYIKRILKRKQFRNANTSDNNYGIPSAWFLDRVSNPHIYKLYNPWKFEKTINKYGFKKIDGMTYGYPFRFLRKLKILPGRLINSFEKKIESILNNVRLPFLSYSGEFYIGSFQKETDSNGSIFKYNGDNGKQ